MSSGNPSSRATAMAMAAKASLISMRSTSAIFQPARCERLPARRARARGRTCPARPPRCRRRRAAPPESRPRASAHAASASTIAAAPLFKPGALPAVIVPSLRKAGFSAASVSSVVSGRLCSSLSNASAPCGRALRRRRSRRRIAGGLRRAKRCCERSAHSVLRLAADLEFLARDPRCASPNARRRTRRSGRRAACCRRAARRPSGSPSGRARCRYGARSMFSMPPATATSTLPSRISCAAETIACAPEPQTRLTVIAGTVTGSPA